MWKRTSIIGLILALGGGVILYWVIQTPRTTATLESLAGPQAYATADTLPAQPTDNDWRALGADSNEALDSGLAELRQKTPEQQAAAKRARLLADLERLAAGDEPEAELGTMLYGPGWQGYVSRYRQEQENRQILLTAAVVLGGLGIGLVSLSLVIGIGHWVARRLRRPNPAPEPTYGPAEVEDTLTASGDVDQASDSPHHDPLTQRPTLDTGRPQLPQRSRLRVDVPETNAEPDVPGGVSYHRVYPSSEEEEADTSYSSSDAVVENLMSDEAEVSFAASATPVLDTTANDPEPVAPVSAPGRPTRTVPRPADGEAAIEEQIAAVAEMAHTVESQQSENSEPVSQTLQMLNEQIAAIRQYASSQQDRVEKLQSGYDWNIIRNFCVRVIRCLDNLELRIDRCDDPDLAQALNEVHDELLFSLESSGVEQFAPEIHTPFSGQERLAEAVKEKVPCDRPELKGCIAEVAKPGYQYVIDDDNAKIVRTARVKLYGSDPSAPDAHR